MDEPNPYHLPGIKIMKQMSSRMRIFC
jgi:hypothetical protein